MKVKNLNVLGLFALILILTSCGREQSGELTGVLDRPNWIGVNPYGMVYVPSGTLNIGASDQDVFSTYTQKSKTISIQGFFMDDTEITNNEYRQFVEGTRDSIAHGIMGDVYEDDFGNERLDWEMEIDMADETLDEMYFEGDMRINDKREINTSKLVFKYQSLDWNRAANSGSKDGVVRSQLIEDHEVAVYPDTLAWIRDYA